MSEIGHAAATLEIEEGVLPDFAAVWYYTHAADEIRISLRRGHPAVDLSKVAPTIVGALSGGGHPGAAGCAVKGSDVKSVFRPHPDPALPPRADRADAGKADE
jgi:nanoRNase/pAp phosphatase (c-di-AMP/oligoRNAs hydrolase)